MEKKEQNKDFKNTPEYQKITNRFFYASLINIPILALPAFGALFLGKFLDAKFQTGKTITLSLLLLAIVFSWFLILWNNKKINREYKKIRALMEETE